MVAGCRNGRRSRLLGVLGLDIDRGEDAAGPCEQLLDAELRLGEQALAATLERHGTLVESDRRLEGLAAGLERRDDSLELGERLVVGEGVDIGGAGRVGHGCSSSSGPSGWSPVDGSPAGGASAGFGGRGAISRSIRPATIIPTTTPTPTISPTITRNRNAQPRSSPFTPPPLPRPTRRSWRPASRRRARHGARFQRARRPAGGRSRRPRAGGRSRSPGRGSPAARARRARP